MAPSLSGMVASEDGIVEKPALALLQDLGWSHVDLRDEVPGLANPTGRTSFRQPHLPVRLRAALARLNPGLPPETLQLAEDAVTRDRTAMLVTEFVSSLSDVAAGETITVPRAFGQWSELVGKMSGPHKERWGTLVG